MSQIAQQDHLYLKSETTLALLEEPLKAKLKNYAKAGVLLDVVIETTEALNKVNVAHVLGYETDTTLPNAPTYKVYCVNSNNAQVVTINLD